MRDIKRIDKVLVALKRFWKQNPDLRLGQIIGNLAESNDPSYYYMDDEILLERLEKNAK